MVVRSTATSFTSVYGTNQNDDVYNIVNADKHYLISFQRFLIC